MMLRARQQKEAAAAAAAAAVAAAASASPAAANVASAGAGAAAATDAAAVTPAFSLLGGDEAKKRSAPGAGLRKMKPGEIRVQKGERHFFGITNFSAEVARPPQPMHLMQATSVTIVTLAHLTLHPTFLQT